MSEQKGPLRIIDQVFDRSGSTTRAFAWLLPILLGGYAVAAVGVTVWSNPSDAVRAANPEKMAPPAFAVTVEPPAVRDEPPPVPESPPRTNPTPRAPAATKAAPRSQVRVAPPPAAAAAVMARESTGPVDLTGLVFITGNAAQVAGGATTSSSPAPTAAGDRPDHSTGGGSRARTVALEDDRWHCPWPREAEGSDSDSAEVLLRVVVARDGHPRSAEVLREPGSGFGRAAVACALTTRFRPAQDPTGTPIEAASPPIRVHFTR